MTDVSRIGLLGAFGIGNRGNDVTLQTFADALRHPGDGSVARSPVAVCPAPDAVRRQGVDATAWTGPRAGRSLPARLAGRAGDLPWAWRVVGGLDALVVAGGGLLEVTRIRAATTAATLATYTWAAHLQRKPVVFWSVGADDLPSGATRALARSALHAATTVTVRDDHSARAVETLGEPAPRQVLDAVLALRAPEHALDPAHPGPPVVAVGVFNARGAKAADGSLVDAERYEAELVRTVCGLVEGGDDVVLLGGAAIDAVVVDDVTARCEDVLGSDATHLRRGAYDDHATVCDTLAHADLAVVSRYHSTMAALTTGTPTVSVGYGPKNRDLMARFDQEQYCTDLSDARAEEILGLVAALRRRASLEARAVQHAAARLRERARAELDDLTRMLPSASSTVGTLT
jgi:polysaccharide pyruvyl transferase WcaK-like protein